CLWRRPRGAQRWLPEVGCSSLGARRSASGVRLLSRKGQGCTLRTKGGKGSCEKSKLSSRSLATRSRSVNGSSPKRCSTNFSNDANSYTVCEMKPDLAKGEMISNGTRGPKPKLFAGGAGT